MMIEMNFDADSDFESSLFLATVHYLSLIKLVKRVAIYFDLLLRFHWSLSDLNLGFQALTFIMLVLLKRKV